jgi:hypothetical protein
MLAPLFSLIVHPTTTRYAFIREYRNRSRRLTRTDRVASFTPDFTVALPVNPSFEPLRAHAPPCGYRQASRRDPVLSCLQTRARYYFFPIAIVNRRLTARILEKFTLITFAGSIGKINVRALIPLAFKLIAEELKSW